MLKNSIVLEQIVAMPTKIMYNFSWRYNYFAYVSYGGVTLREHESIGRLVSVINRHVKCFISKELEPYNLGSGQFHYLLMLYKNDGISQEEMTKYIIKDKGTTARAIKKLENEGYITRKVNIKDKRAYKIYLTQKALDMKPIITKVLRKSTQILESGFSREEKNMAVDILKKMAHNTAEFMKITNSEWR